MNREQFNAVFDRLNTHADTLQIMQEQVSKLRREMTELRCACVEEHLSKCASRRTGIERIANVSQGMGATGNSAPGSSSDTKIPLLSTSPSELSECQWVKDLDQNAYNRDGTGRKRRIHTGLVVADCGGWYDCHGLIIDDGQRIRHAPSPNRCMLCDCPIQLNAGACAVCLGEHGNRMAKAAHAYHVRKP